MSLRPMLELVEEELFDEMTNREVACRRRCDGSWRATDSRRRLYLYTVVVHSRRSGDVVEAGGDRGSCD